MSIRIFLLLIQNIDCGHSLEPPHRVGSNVCPHNVLNENIENTRINIFPMKLSFCTTEKISKYFMSVFL